MMRGRKLFIGSTCWLILWNKLCKKDEALFRRLHRQAELILILIRSGPEREERQQSPLNIVNILAIVRLFWAVALLFTMVFLSGP